LLRANVDLALLEIGRYMSGDTALTSVGARLEMWRVSYEIFSGSPFWGHGTGSYRALSEKIFTDPAICTVSCIHPHNQFLFFGVEYGLVGIVAYMFFLWRPFAYGIACVGRERLMLVCLVTVMFVDSFINGPLWVTTERHLFTSVLPLFMAGWRPPGLSGECDGDGLPLEADSA
jgi:O-antigen ligase